MTMLLTTAELEKLIQCLNSLKHIRNDMPSAKIIYPGLDGIIDEAEDVLKDNPDIVPSWYKVG